ncbi:MAG: LysM peptidoglycan-binding domain-containing protein [Firmicutes bacterium]|nr:LysM peptidoglycan-binding domain-containing protein [Bacillota bacterium]
MRLWRGFRPRYLRLGSQGDEVRWLQRRLLDLGYDPGDVDGYFGHRTHAAVLNLQRDFGQKPDGIAGPRLYDLLNQEILPVRQCVYVLAPGETLTDAARSLGTSVEALRYMNRLPSHHRGFAGQRLIFRSHYIVGAFSGFEHSALYALRKVAAMLSAVVIPVGMISDGQVEILRPNGKIPETVRHYGLELWGVVSAAERMKPTDLDLLVRKRRYLRQWIQALIDQSKELDAGLWLDLGSIRWGDGLRLERLARMIKEADASVRFMVTLPMPRSQAPKYWWLSDVNYARLALLADKVVIAGHWPGPPEDLAAFNKRLRGMLHVVPPWKGLLGINLGAEVRDVRHRLLAETSYRQAISAAYLAGVRPRWDDERSLLRAALPPKEGDDESDERVLWIAGQEAVKRRVHAAVRLHMAGVLIWPLGEEDTRLWDVLRKRIQPQRMNA